MPDAIVSSLARALLQVVAGSLITRGYLTAGDADLIVGAAVALVGAVWSVLAKRRAAKETQAAVAVAQASIPAEVVPTLEKAAAVTERAGEVIQQAQGLADKLRAATGLDGRGA